LATILRNNEHESKFDEHEDFLCSFSCVTYITVVGV